MVCVADDILIFGATLAEHDKRLEALLKRCSDTGIKLNKDKSVWRSNSLDFLGYRITSEGLEPDPRKVEAIMDMKNPLDQEGIRRILGSIGYLSKFLPHLSTVAEPLRRLQISETWEWTSEHDAAMLQLKKLVSEAPILAFYDPKLPLVVECDASSTGLGAVLMQQEKSLAYASRALSSSEQHYAQIEKECLAVVFAMERFHQYTYGRMVQVHSDHKPLEMILKKPLSKAPKRLQAMMLRLLQYDIVLTHKRGNLLFIADMLSRAYLETPSPCTDIFSRVNTIIHLSVSKKRLDEFRATAQQDSVIMSLMRVIKYGWPTHMNDTPECNHPYFSIRD